MADKGQKALDAFWRSFGWDTFEENVVPENAVEKYGKYITYSAGTNGFDEPMMLTASVWQKSRSWAEVVEKAEEIFEAIGLGGKVIDHEDGKLWIKRGNPFSQRMADEDTEVRRIYINVEVEFFTTK